LVIVISGFPRMTEGLREKADLVLHKPVDVRQLAGLIQRLQVGNPNLLPADFDPFETRILDEAAFIERVGYNLARTRKQESLFALIAVRLERISPDEEIPEDIDQRLTVEIARRLRRRLRLVDLTTRSADGMAVVMLYEIREPKNATEIAGRLSEILGQPFIYDGLEIVHTASTGVVLSSPEMDDALRMFAVTRKAAKDAAQLGTRVHVATEPREE
jgi:GGDEF domain-containing protein